MKVHLIIGASGLIGEHLRRTLLNIGFDPLCTYNKYAVNGMRQLDIRNRVEVLSLLEEASPAYVYLTAAMSNVDYCEENPEAAYAINVTGTRYVVEATNHVRAKLVFFSSECIFDGQNGPYREEDTANPICEYGRQKLAAEHYVALHAHDFFIVRTNMVYGREQHGKNFAYALGDTLKAGKVMDVPCDRWVNPTYAPDLARAVVEIVLSGVSGIYNIAGPERMSRHDFACRFADIFRFDRAQIRAIHSDQMKTPARRPLNAGLVTEKVFSVLKSPLGNVEQGLRQMSKEVNFDES